MTMTMTMTMMVTVRRRERKRKMNWRRARSAEDSHERRSTIADWKPDIESAYWRWLSRLEYRYREELKSEGRNSTNAGLIVREIQMFRCKIYT
jgi:hypothetical protein